jgi:hypothetical protein
MGCGHYSRLGWKRSVAKIKNAKPTSWSRPVTLRALSPVLLLVQLSQLVPLNPNRLALLSRPEMLNPPANAVVLALALLPVRRVATATPNANL